MNQLTKYLTHSILEDEISAEIKTNNTTNTIHIPANVIEEWVITKLPSILKEASNISGFSEVDDGPNFFFRDFRVFDKVSRYRAEQIGWDVIKQLIDASFQDLTVYPEYPYGPVKAVTPFPAGVIGKTTATNQKDFATDRAFQLWSRHAARVATIVGYSLVRDRDDIIRKLSVGSASDIYTDETVKEPSSVNESTFFTKTELEEITNDIMSELGGLMIGYAGKDDIQKKQKQLKKLRKKLDKTTPNYPAIKEEYDRLGYYLEYYKNLTPATFSVDRDNNKIIITQNTISENDMGNRPYTVDIQDLTINNTNFRDTRWTGNHLQMTVMDIPADDDIGLEVHPNGDQFIRVESGVGEVHMGKTKETLDFVKRIKDDTAIFIPAGYWHNIKNIATIPLKLYVIYAPVEHERGRVDVLKPVDVTETVLKLPSSLGIPRHKMPQIASANVGEYISFLKSNGIKVSGIKVDVSSLKMTQSGIDMNKVNRLVADRDMKTLSKPVIISKDGYVLDGHHRVAALYNLDSSFKLKVVQVHLPIRKLLEVSFKFPKVFTKNITENKEITEAPLPINMGLKLIAQNTIDGVKEGWWYIVKKVEGAIGNLTYYLQPLNSKKDMVTVRAKSPADFYTKVIKKK